MSTLINKTQETLEELKKQNKIQEIDYKVIEEIDNLMKEIHREYIIKANRSWINSENCYVSRNLN